MTSKPSIPGEQTAPEPQVGGDQVNRQLGERVRTIRKRKAWTLEELAAASGVSRSMLSQIERHQANPTVGVVYRIAKACGLSLTALLEDPDGATTIDVIRADDRTYHYRLDRKCRWRTLSPLYLEKDLEFHELQLKPGGLLHSARHFNGTREFATVQRGSVRITAGSQTSDLNKGDSAYYPADVDHTITNIGREEAVLFLVVAYMRE